MQGEIRNQLRWVLRFSFRICWRSSLFAPCSLPKEKRFHMLPKRGRAQAGWGCEKDPQPHEDPSAGQGVRGHGRHQDRTRGTEEMDQVVAQDCGSSPRGRNWSSTGAAAWPSSTSGSACTAGSSLGLQVFFPDPQGERAPRAQPPHDAQPLLGGSVQTARARQGCLLSKPWLPEPRVLDSFYMDLSLSLTTRVASESLLLAGGASPPSLFRVTAHRPVSHGARPFSVFPLWSAAGTLVTCYMRSETWSLLPARPSWHKEVRGLVLRAWVWRVRAVSDWQYGPEGGAALRARGPAAVSACWSHSFCPQTTLKLPTSWREGESPPCRIGAEALEDWWSALSSPWLRVLQGSWAGL